MSKPLDKPPMPCSPAADPWQAWRSATPARIALGRAGVATPTGEALRFAWAHACARDAVQAPLDVQALQAALQADGWPVLQAGASQAGDRSTYLRRPDLGRRLGPAGVQQLQGLAPAPQGGAPRLALIVADGLSSLAVQRHVPPLLRALRGHLPADLSVSPIVIVTQARVAIGDEIGQLLGADLALIMIGERPGLSSPDSLGLYLTFGPRVGRHDAERNCISNVRPEGLACDAAAFKAAWLMRHALRLGLTGVALKDDSDLDLIEPAPAQRAGVDLPR